MLTLTGDRVRQELNVGLKYFDWLANRGMRGRLVEGGPFGLWRWVAPDYSVASIIAWARENNIYWMWQLTWMGRCSSRQ